MRKQNYVDRAKLSPARTFKSPMNVVEANDINPAEKVAILEGWEADERALLRAEDEGMGGRRARTSSQSASSPRPSRTRSLPSRCNSTCGRALGVSAGGLLRVISTVRELHPATAAVLADVQSIQMGDRDGVRTPRSNVTFRSALTFERPIPLFWQGHIGVRARCLANHCRPAGPRAAC